MAAFLGRRVGRRWVLRQAAGGAVGFAVLGLAGCGSDEDASDDARDTPSPAESPAPSPAESPTTTAGDGLAWERVDLGFVAAYVLVRGSEAAVVDTGVAGSEDEIAAVLDDAGPGWAGVRHVVLTHKHPDHAGSVDAALRAAPAATGYVGAEDLPAVTGSADLRALGDGEEVFGLRVVATPGHTAGHLAVFDEETGVLVAGDALTNDGGLAGSNPQFTEDEAAAAASVARLADLRPRTILVGHGPPVTEGAAEALQRLAGSVS